MLRGTKFKKINKPRKHLLLGTRGKNSRTKEIRLLELQR